MDVLYIPQLDEIGTGGEGEGGGGGSGGTADTVTAAAIAAARTRFSLPESEITAILAESAAD